MKILCIEDGSVDLNALEEEPLRDGKVLVYRKGATPPYVVELTDTNVNAIKELIEVKNQLATNDRLQCLNYVVNRIKELGGDEKWVNILMEKY